MDVLAAAPLVSATTLVAGLDMAMKNATALLEGFCRLEIVVEVTHRAKRRLFGLAPLCDSVAPPYRPVPERARGQGALRPEQPPMAPLTPVERREFNHSDLERWMAEADQAIRKTKRVLDDLVRAD